MVKVSFKYRRPLTNSDDLCLLFCLFKSFLCALQDPYVIVHLEKKIDRTLLRLVETQNYSQMVESDFLVRVDLI